MTDEQHNTKGTIFTQTKNAKNHIYKIKQLSNCQKLLLRPNGNNIIINVKEGEFALFQKSLLYVNCQNFISMPKDFEQTEQTIYEGGIEGSHFLPFGNGLFKNSYGQFDGYFKDGFASELCKIEIAQLKSKIQCQYSWGQRHGKYQEQNDSQFIEGQYENSLKQGLFILQQKIDNKKTGEKVYKMYKNGFKVDIANSDETQKKISTATRYILNHKDFSISNYSFLGFNYGGWLNQLGVDYYLQLVVDYYKVIFGKSIQLLNTVDCQDIFSSLITSKDTKVIILPNLIEISAHLSEIKKLIFIMNVDRGHFLALVYQNEHLYMLNSLNNNQDKAILQKVAKIFPKMNKESKGEGNISILNVAQQTNNFDCGIHAIYNTILQYKQIDKNVNEIEYYVTKKMMEKFRTHIKNVLINDFAHILPQISDSKQNHRY